MVTWREASEWCQKRGGFQASLFESNELEETIKNLMKHTQYRNSKFAGTKQN